jgi:hypothetical protein
MPAAQNTSTPIAHQAAIIFEYSRGSTATPIDPNLWVICSAREQLLEQQVKQQITDDREPSIQ